MPLFACQNPECGVVENTALANYWSRKLDGKRLLCSACDPEIGRWHGRFPRRPAAGMLVDQSGHLWSPELVARGELPLHYSIVGTVGGAVTCRT